MASEQDAGASVVEGGWPESTPKAAKTAATSPRQEERERLHEEEGRAQRPRVELRLRDGPQHRGRAAAKNDADRGRVHQGMPDDRG